MSNMTDRRRIFDKYTSILKRKRNIFCRCLIDDEKMRYTALQLLNHPFLKEPLEKYSPQYNIDNNEDRDKSLDQEAAELKLLSQSNSRGPSRVHSEFEVLHCVGKGAYGEVFKVILLVAFEVLSVI